MTIRRGALNWGVFLILLGFIPLAVQQGWISAEVVRGAWRLWPLILVGLGIGLILERTSLGAIGGVIVAATFGLMFGGLLATGIGGIGSIGSFVCGDTSTGQTVERKGTFTQGGASVHIDFTCGTLTVQPGSGGDWQVTSIDSSGKEPTISSSDHQLTVRSPEENIPFFGSSAQRTWTVTLPTERSLDFSLAMNAGKGTFDLGGLQLDRLAMDSNATDNRLMLTDTTVGDLRVTLNAGSLGIELPKTGVSGSIEGNAASVRLCAPAGAGLQLRTEDNVTASNNYAQRGLVQSGSTWTTPGYATAAVKIDLRTTGNAISFVLDPTGGCR